MIGKVFRVFREKGGILKALDLWEWFENLPHDKQKKVKYYFSLKSIKNLNFPYRAKHFDSGDIQGSPYTKRTFLGSIAQMALLEGDYEFAEWLYLQALDMEGTPFEAHLILNDLVMLAQKLKDMEKAGMYAEKDLELFKDYEEEIKRRHQRVHLNSLEFYVYFLERQGKVERALKVLDEFKARGVEHTFYEDVKERLQRKIQGP